MSRDPVNSHEQGTKRAPGHVFVLHHSYDLDDCEETKLIGVYRSRQNAVDAAKRLSKQPGFRDRVDRFSVDEYELDVDHWTEGFFTD